MTISLYNLGTNAFLQIIGGVITCLDRGLEYCRENGLDPDEIAKSRLHPDMNPFYFQVQAITHHSIGALHAVKDGGYVAKPEAPSLGYVELQKMVVDAQDALRHLTPAEIDGCAGGEVVFRFKEISFPFTTEDFLLSFALPNFYFHVTTAYGILRKHGVPVGKIDYLGQMRIKG